MFLIYTTHSRHNGAWHGRMAEFLEPGSRAGPVPLYNVRMDPLLAPMQGAEHRLIGGVQVDVSRCGSVRVKRMIYPPGFSWAEHLSGIMGSKLCMHAHVGFMAAGQINVRFADGCVQEYKAPQFVAVEPGHEGWVVGNEPAVLIEFDFEGETVGKLGLPSVHHHGEGK